MASPSHCPMEVEPLASSSVINEETMDVCLDVDPCTLIKPKVEPTNMVSGVFLKNMFFLNAECSKFVITGLFHDRSFGLGLAVFSKKTSVFLNYNIVSQLVPLITTVTAALEAGGGKHVFQLESGEEISARKLFGKWYINLFDRVNTVAFSLPEWLRFVSCLPVLLITMQELSADENRLQSFIVDSLGQSAQTPLPSGLYRGEQLVHELHHFKCGPA